MNTTLLRRVVDRMQRGRLVLEMPWDGVFGLLGMRGVAVAS